MLQKLEIFLKRKIRHGFSSYYRKKDSAKLQNKDFVLISRNCWGGQVYQWLNLPYNTPFVGLFLFGPCYMKLLRDFDKYMAMDIDRRGITEENIKEFHQMNFRNKISFSFQKISGLSNLQHIKFIQDLSKHNGAPPNGRKRFKLTFLYFDLVNYLNTENVVRTRFKD